VKNDGVSVLTANRESGETAATGLFPAGGPGRIRKSKTSRWRAAVLIGITLLMIAHIIQWRMTGRTISPIEPSETMHTLQRGELNAGFIFFSLAILATLIFGRFVCGWACHILALQDLCGWALKKMRITPKPFRSRLLVYVPLLGALYMFVWPTAYRFFSRQESEPLIPKLTNHLVTTDFWGTFPSVAVAIPFLAICGFLTVWFLGQKGFCTYACPYGGFFSLADKLSPLKIRVTDACNQCGHCTSTCTSNVLVHAEVKTHRMVVDPGCMKCMDCISVCPNDALYLGFGKLALGHAPARASGKHYSLTWPEEIFGALIFAGSFFAVRGVYGLVPFLMALGCGAVTTFLALKTWRLFTRSDVFLHKFALKLLGKIRAAGWAFLVFSISWLGLAAHSGWIRYHEFQGERAFQKVQIPDELALAQPNPDPWLTPADRENVAAGAKHLTTVGSHGLFGNSDALSKLAWLEFLSGHAGKATDLLNDAAREQKGQAKALSLYYRGSMLNLLGNYEQGLNSLDAALTERPDLILARQEKGESLWKMGREDEAIATWTNVVQENPNISLANDELAGALRARGQLDVAAAFERQADGAAPDNPFYHWTLGLRLKNLGMNDLAEKHFQRAVQLDSRFQSRPN
jgi:tetratricopeptide (TPR) repeat protein/NAD-dependent dihydropyrimidine dehydrogenase PreA subunit